MRTILLIPKIKIHNANALSSPYTIGFPSMTAWLGGTHALERKLKDTDHKNVSFRSIAVTCHDIELQVYKNPGDYSYSLVVTKNPPIRNKDRRDAIIVAPFIEEARCHLTVSLVIECLNLAQTSYNNFTDTVDNLLMTMKLTSGDIIDIKPSKIFEVKDDKSRQKFLRQLMPGHCLIERKDLIIKEMESGNDALDAILNHVKVTNEFNRERNVWDRGKKERGWIVPIATGYHGITDIGKAENQRDPKVPHRFAESVVTLGEFIMPYRITDLDNMLWHYETDLKNNLYLCKQNKPITEGDI